MSVQGLRRFHCIALKRFPALLRACAILSYVSIILDMDNYPAYGVTELHD